MNTELPSFSCLTYEEKSDYYKNMVWFLQQAAQEIYYGIMKTTE